MLKPRKYAKYIKNYGSNKSQWVKVQYKTWDNIGLIISKGFKAKEVEVVYLLDHSYMFEYRTVFIYFMNWNTKLAWRKSKVS